MVAIPWYLSSVHWEGSGCDSGEKEWDVRGEYGHAGLASSQVQNPEAVPLEKPSLVRWRGQHR
jgi:hypothetical protein